MEILRQVWELDRGVTDTHGMELERPPSDLLGFLVCVYHHTYNNDFVEVDCTENIKWLPMPSKFLEFDEVARFFFSCILSIRGVTVDELMLRELLSLSRLINGDRTDHINVHTTIIPLLTIRVKIHIAPSSYDETQAVIQAMEESMENYMGLQMAPARKSSVDALEKVTVDPSCSMDQCMICLDKFCVDDDQVLVTRMPCSHVYHGHCIDEWLKTSHFCPLCRFEMPT